jgi:hypothetical protein
MKGDTMPDQMPLPIIFADDEVEDMHTFLAQWLAIKSEEERLREEKKALRDAYQERIGLKALLTAIRRVEAQRKLEQDQAAPVPRAYQAQYEAVVEGFLDRIEAEREAVIREVAAMGRPKPGDMLGGVES